MNPRRVEGEAVLVHIQPGMATHAALHNISWPLESDGRPVLMEFESEASLQARACLGRVYRARNSIFRLEMKHGTAYGFRGHVNAYDPETNTGCIQVDGAPPKVDECDRLEKVDVFSRMDLDAKVWRYMSMAQFVHLGSTKGLLMQSVFNRRRNDPYEGLLPPSLASDNNRNNRPDNPWPWLTNSWCLSEYNNFALWDVYGSREGVAVQTTVDRLQRALNVGQHGTRINRSLFKVYYADYDATERPEGLPQGSWLNDERLPFLCKRREYAHEQEVRVLEGLADFQLDAMQAEVVDVDDATLADSTLNSPMPIRPERWIEAVYAHPHAERWVGKAIREQIRNWGWKNTEFVPNGVPTHSIIPPFKDARSPSWPWCEGSMRTD